MTPYAGSARRLALSFDVGTTFSGMSYCLLDPGQVPKICNITRYPGQEHAAGSAKIPTILCYDRQGNVRAAGAEALSDESAEKIEDEEWIKVEWFKVRMRPTSMPSALKFSELPPLPPNKTLVQVFGDFLTYLMTCAERFIRDTHITIERNWDELRADAVFVIGHPNGWEGAQQSMLRRAAILAAMVPDTLEGRSRVKFVSEGEASLNFCLRENVVENDSKGFIIADLGGGTLDFSAYKLLGTNPLRVEEVSAAKCELQGSTMVTMRAKNFIKEKLRESRYGSDDHVKQIAERFDESTKKTFRHPNDLCLVSFGSVTDKDQSCDIRSGKLKLAGETVATFFKPSISASVSAITDLKDESKIEVSAVYLVGGFAASPYLISQLKEHLSRFNITVSIPDGQTAKAVADGALSFYLENYVMSRIAKISYCIAFGWDYDDDKCAGHRNREKVWTNPSGRRVVGGGLNTILRSGTSVTSETEFRIQCNQELININTLDAFSVDLLAFRDSGVPPYWKDEIKNKALLKKICTITGNTSALKVLMHPLVGTNGKYYWSFNYDIVIKFGETELQAQIAWIENGVERRGPASIIYEDLINEQENDEVVKIKDAFH